jgi:hypothetical protein
MVETRWVIITTFADGSFHAELGSNNGGIAVMQVGGKNMIIDDED